MSCFVSLGIIFLSSLIFASLQLPLGSFLLLYHSSLIRNIKKKTRTLASSFISGAVFMIFILLSASCFLISSISISGTLSLVSILILAGIMFALGMIALFFYYKRNSSTELWIPRKLAKFINTRAKHTSDSSEAFSLGLFAIFSELLFSLPLIIISSNSILSLDQLYQVLALIIFVLISASPLLILRLSIRKGKNLADIQRWRIKNKSFLRIFTGISYMILASFVFAFLILGGK